MTFAIVPAAGNSMRMGRPKLLLRFGDRTVIERIVQTLRIGGVDRVIVVIGQHVRELAPLAESAGAAVCVLAEPTPDMRATVQHGLGWIEHHYQPEQRDPWLLAPADHPMLNAEVVRLLLSRFSENGGSIVAPIHSRRRGHPTLFAWKHVAGIRALPANEGINAYLRQHSADTVEVEVNDPGILTDLDTPEDYERLLRSVRAK